MNTLAKKDDKRYEYFIYKLYNPDCDFIYVGSTRDMTARKNKHKSDCNNVNNKKYNLKVYKTIREHNGWDEWFMVVLEVMPDVTKMTAEMQEDAYRVQLNATMNSKRASCGGISIEEYNKQRYIDNRETILARVNQYQIDNKEAISKQKRQHYQDNREQILEKAYQKHDCLCGGKYTLQNKSKHLRTQKHKSYLLSLAI